MVGGFRRVCEECRVQHDQMFLPCHRCLVDIYACALKGPRVRSDSAARVWGQADSNGVFLLEKMAKAKRNVNSMPGHGEGSQRKEVRLHP